LHICVPQRTSYKEQKLLTLREHPSLPTGFLWCPCCSYIFCVVLWCVFTFWVPCCDVLYDVRIKTMFVSSLSLLVCRRAHILLMLFVFLCVYWCPTHTVLCFCFAGLRLVYPMLPGSLDCSFLITPSVFSNIYVWTIQFVIWAAKR
jgi:hypothetical protein